MELTKEDYDKLEEISDKASKEYGIEKILQKMKDVKKKLLIIFLHIQLLISRIGARLTQS